MADPNQGGLFERLGNLVELITTLDVRVTNALEGLEEMRTSVTGLDPVRDDAELMMADLKERLDVWDRRLDDDLRELKTLAVEKLNGLDELKALAMEKLASLDLNQIDARFEAMQRSLTNVEKSTSELNQVFQGSVEALPNFMTKRVVQERRKRSNTGPEPLPNDDLSG